jgi:hypothetical protein
MTWYAKIDKPSDRTILNLMDIATRGEYRPWLTSPEEVAAFLAAHPEVEAVNVYSSDFPRRPVPVEKFGPAMVRRLFPKATRTAGKD